MGDISNELHDYIAQSRIRSARRRKRDAIEDKDKKLIQLYKESRALNKQKQELPMIDLVPPVQKGWKRYFVLREDVRRSKIGGFYEKILLKINTIQYSDDKVFKRKIKKHGKKIYVDREHHLKEMYNYEWQKLKFDEREAACFELRTTYERYGKNIRTIQKYVFKEPWRFVFRIRPNIIDKVKAFDNELEKRIAEIKQNLWDNQKNNSRIRNLRGLRSYRRRDDKEIEKYHNPLKNKRLDNIPNLDI